MTDSRSALTAACRNGHSDVVSLLLEHRAQINKPSKSGATPLYAACSGSHYELASSLLERGADPSLALPYSVRDGAVDVARYLLEKERLLMIIAKLIMVLHAPLYRDRATKNTCKD